MEVVIQDLHKRYGKVHALRGVNLRIRAGMFGLLGPNGAGKTTVMCILATRIPETSGTVHIGPFKLDTEPHKVLEILSYLPQSVNTYRNTSTNWLSGASGCFSAGRGCGSPWALRCSTTRTCSYSMSRLSIWIRTSAGSFGTYFAL